MIAAIVPLALVSHQLLALLTNSYLDAFNELRECAPIAVASDIALCLKTALAAVAKHIQEFHGANSRTFDAVSAWAWRPAHDGCSASDPCLRTFAAASCSSLCHAS